MGLRFTGGLNIGSPGVQLGSVAVDPLAGLLDGRWKASQIGAPVTNGNPIGTTWVNIGDGSPSDMMQGEGTQPSWIESDSLFNGQPSVLFDAVKNGMDESFPIPSPYTLMFCARAVDTSIQLTSRTFNSQDANALISINRIGFAVFNGSIIYNDTSADGTTAHILMLEVQSSGYAFYIDGTQVASGSTAIPDWERLSFGWTNSQQEAANAAIAEAAVLLGVNATIRNLVQATWKAQYGTP